MYNGVAEDVIGQLQNTGSSGGDILGRWNHQFGNGSGFQLQSYFSRTKRNVISGISAAVNTYDLDAQYNFGIGSQQWVVGGGYRVTEDNFRPGPGTSFLTPARRTLSLGNIFLQDRIALSDDVALTLGLKLENNSYTGWEYMPDGRLSWRVTDTDFLWAAVSRAVRTPSRFDRDLFGPGFGGGPHFESEDLTALEAGYRGEISPAFSFSVSGFYNIYENLRTVEATTPFVIPLMVKNGMEGETYGVEAWGTYSLTDWWRLSAGVSTLQKDLRLIAGSRDIFGVAFAGNDPEYQAQLRSRMNVGNAVELDLGLRAVDALESPRVPGYVEADVRVGWHVTETLELSVTGQNLLHARHTEFINGSLPAQAVPRSATVELRWSY
jgi:iron complex outermembrane receptor protein